MKIDQEAKLMELQTNLALCLEEYVKEHGTKGLCWFCMNQYKIKCDKSCGINENLGI